MKKIILGLVLLVIVGGFLINNHKKNEIAKKSQEDYYKARLASEEILKEKLEEINYQSSIRREYIIRGATDKELEILEVEFKERIRLIEAKRIQ